MTLARQIMDPADVARYREAYPSAFARPAAERVKRWAAWSAFATFTMYAFWKTDFFDLQRFITGAVKFGTVLGLMFPPAHHGWFWDFFGGILQTLAMAFLGTLLAAIAAIPFGFMGAKNVLPNRLLHFGLRRLFDGLRGVDALIWALIFINVVGLGPFAGILAIAVSDTGTLSKLFSEAIENADPRQVEGVRASGAGPLEVMRLGVLPQVFPIMLSTVLYYFESNTRSATILGVVGAGGIGLQLSDRIRVNNWDEVCFIIIMILVTVSLIDFLSRTIRLRLIGTSDAKI